MLFLGLVRLVGAIAALLGVVGCGSSHIAGGAADDDGAEDGGSGRVDATPAADAGEDPDGIDPRRFDLTRPSYDLFRNASLHEDHHAMQGFAFDVQNRRLFVAQLQDGTSGDDLCVSELSDTGALLGHMHLDGAGHGVSIGAEPVGEDTYLWVETDSHTTTEAGRGTALLRFKFEDGTTPAGSKFLTGSRTITCATDPVHQRIAVRRNEGGEMAFTIYDLESAAQGDLGQPLARFVQPALSDTAVTFQGYTLYGEYVYTLDGTGHDDPADINSYVTAIDVRTGEVVSRELTLAGKSLVYREPEGMAIDRTADGEVRLLLGFASRDGIDRFASLFFKNVLVE